LERIANAQNSMSNANIIHAHIIIQFFAQVNKGLFVFKLYGYFSLEI